MRTAQIAKGLTEFILSSGYTQSRLADLGLTKTPWRPANDRALLPYRVDEASVLGLLIRAFFFGEAVPSAALCAIPAGVLENLIEAGTLERQDDEFVPTCMLTHFADLLLACDSVRRIHGGVLEDLVLGVSRPTQILGHCMLPVRPGSSVLDLGTGCGPLALKAAQTAGHVIGTDINPRALQFAQFNAALNGIANVEFRCGDRFEPVARERFDLIVSNPPFFLAPQSKLLFTDNPFHLDLFAEGIAREAPKFLNENGYFQMLCEWVETPQDRERPRNWFVESGCAALILEDYAVKPEDYSAARIAEASALHADSDAASVAGYMRYFAEHGVEKIRGGLISLRKSRPYWLVEDQMEEKPASPAGHLLAERFTVEDLISGGDSQLLARRPQLARDAVLVTESAPENQTWKPARVYLERRSSLPCRLGFSPEIASLLAHWDGSQNLAALAAAYAQENGLPLEQVARNFLGLARRLAAKNLIQLLQ